MFKLFSSSIIVLQFLFPLLLQGQTPTDGLMMDRRELCTVVQLLIILGGISIGKGSVFVVMRTLEPSLILKFR